MTTGVYSTKLLNSKMVANNAYITVGDPYQNPQENPFRQPKKGEKAPTPFQVKVRVMFLFRLFIKFNNQINNKFK